MIDNQTTAAKSFYREIRTFSERTRPWDTAVFYHTKPDEALDATLVSERVYGRRDEFLAVMAAAGIDTANQPIPQKMLTLPTETQLAAIKRRTGFESIADYRENFAPTWAS
ncbi:hypothetical protein F6R98_10470 [Candidatus Methylospira mobilis]|uniref:Uncharacterized protein n=1 Tax=Candidatus Methylospira mobilis TaxID=1808979 RepID=A0A5Q0BMM4_9GAMM|nr:hypothetical protein [Candidatus Methylospira mobilis]QFY42986.1 hypothetical protein F6R98_10470 [Candidatus Methylospira mobilis]